MNLLEMSLETVQKELKRKPYPTKQDYEREVLQSIRRFEGKAIFEAYRVLEEERDRMGVYRWLEDYRCIRCGEKLPNGVTIAQKEHLHFPHCKGLKNKVVE